MAATDDAALMEMDLYALLGAPEDAVGGDLTRRYRKRALVCHPDKNPDDAAAADKFHLLTRAYELLADEERRAVYDSRRRARVERKRKFAALDAQNKAMREDLEQRERAAEQAAAASTQQRNRLDEIRAQNRDALARLREKKRQAAAAEAAAAATVTLKVRWDKKVACSEAAVHAALTAYGRVESVALFPGKGKGAVVLVATPEAVDRAVVEVRRAGDCPVTVTRLGA